MKAKETIEIEIKEQKSKPSPDCPDCFGTGCSCGGIGLTHWSDEICCTTCRRESSETKVTTMNQAVLKSTEQLKEEVYLEDAARPPQWYNGMDAGNIWTRIKGLAYAFTKERHAMAKAEEMGLTEYSILRITTIRSNYGR